MTDNLEFILLNWGVWKESLAEAKEKEMSFRKHACKLIFNNSESEESKEVVKGVFKYKAKQGLNRSIDKSALESIYNDLSDEEKKCIKWEPKVSWTKIPEDSILWDIITEKPATPTLTRLALEE